MKRIISVRTSDLLACALGMLICFGSGNAGAQAPPANGGVLINVSPRALKLLEDFKLNPAGLISRNPPVGGALAFDIRDILVADKGQLSNILALVPQATAAQQEVLGTGLGLARLLYVRDPEFASDIQTQIVALNNLNVLRGFSIFGGGGVAALFGGSIPPAAAPLVLGPVGSIASAPAANSNGRGGAGGAGGDEGGSAGIGSSRSLLQATSTSP
jgi:hypothetical protein